MSRKFLEITPREIYLEIKEMHKKLDDIHYQTKRINGSVKINRAWLGSLTAACGAAFMYILTWVVK